VGLGGFRPVSLSQPLNQVFQGSLDARGRFGTGFLGPRSGGFPALPCHRLVVHPCLAEMIDDGRRQFNADVAQRQAAQKIDQRTQIVVADGVLIKRGHTRTGFAIAGY